MSLVTQPEDEVIQLEDMQVLRLEPGDIVVLRTNHSISEENGRRITVLWDRLMERCDLKGKVSMILLEEGMRMGVLRTKDVK